MTLDFYWIHFVAFQKLGNKKPPSGSFFIQLETTRVTLNERASYRSRYRSIHNPSLQMGT